ncbi:hemerythrin family protein [Magnetovibrio sp. PR-2]|uniref:bacteriohemerythrin n=1 Tax=Magnetovibrio sp. PR-2 TaxID=3120356 RepID=UPI002FCE2A59
MSLILWSDTMKVGVPSIDHEHEHLIDVINKLGEEIELGTSPDMLETLLGEIYAQVESHFTIEERVMREHAYPGFSAHRKDHETLLDSIQTVMDEVSYSTSSEISGALGRKMSIWFTEHFRTRDRDFSQFASDHRH